MPDVDEWGAGFVLAGQDRFPDRGGDLLIGSGCCPQASPSLSKGRGGWVTTGDVRRFPSYIRLTLRLGGYPKTET
jgi:hypothetical protein